MTLKKPRMIAAEHCWQYDNKYTYYSVDDFTKGENGSAVFHCSKKTLYVSPLSSGQITMSNDPNSPFNQVAQSNTSYSSTSSSSTSQNMSGASASQLKIYNASSLTTYYFFEASHNLISALELLYRAYDQNLEADKLKAQIEYNRESKYSEADKLNSTRSIIDVSSKKITANINDASQVLSDIGRGYYEQSLPYAYSATQNSILLAMTIKNTVEKSSEGTESLLQNLGEVVGFFTILKDLPQFAKDMQSTSKLIFGGAKAKKIRDKGNHGKALEELNLN